MPAKASIDNCGNCRYWDTRDENLSEEDRADEHGVCRIMSYPEEFGNGFAFLEPVDPHDANAVVITAEEFFCNLYKVDS
jgi:hypothetical protein